MWYGLAEWNKFLDVSLAIQPTLVDTDPVVGTLENGYIRNVPLPRFPRIQSTSQVADDTN